MNYYEHWLGDYRKKTGRLRILEHGVYRLLLDECYATEQPLPASIDELCVICGAMDRRDREAVQKVADSYFPVGPDGMRRNARVEEEIERAQPRIAAARANVKRATEARAARKANTPRNTLGDPPCNPSGNPPGTHGVTHAGEAFPHTPVPKIKNQYTDVAFAEKPPANSDVIPLPAQEGKPSRLQTEAAEVLTFLNERTGRHFRAKKAALAPIMARLKEGYSASECRAVIARKVREWSADDRMRPYLRPATLFGAEKFAQYVGEVPPPEETADAL